LNQQEKELLSECAGGLGISLSKDQLHLLGIHLDELWQWNRKINLTGLSSKQGIIRELLVDSLLPASHLPESGRLLDIGSGAGFPGIPLKITRPGLEVHLIEANSKKASFLRHVIRTARLTGIEVIRGRVEREHKSLHPEKYHIVTARAFSPLPQCLSLCAPFLRHGGLFVNFQGNRFEKILKEGSGVIEEQELTLQNSIPYKLPGTDTQRQLLIFKKKAVAL
jgi:16S rRNA (guanine527-N7)-methyltransferase